MSEEEGEEGLAGWHGAGWCDGVVGVVARPELRGTMLAYKGHDGAGGAAHPGLCARQGASPEGSGLN